MFPIISVSFKNPSPVDDTSAFKMQSLELWGTCNYEGTGSLQLSADPSTHHIVASASVFYSHPPKAPPKKQPISFKPHTILRGVEISGRPGWILFGRSTLWLLSACKLASILVITWVTMCIHYTHQLTFLLTAPKHLVAVQMYPRDTGKCLTYVQILDIIKDKTIGSGSG